jgi:quercetin dioxygenase-like cupin family protein
VVRTSEALGAMAIADDEATDVWAFGELLITRMPSELTGGAFALIEHRCRRGQASPWHRQLADDETFYVVEGEVTFWAGDPAEPLLRGGPATTVYVPRGTPHSFRVDSETATLLAVSTPGGHERFFADAGEVAAQRALPDRAHPDPERVEVACRRHSVEILGPPPGLASVGG